MTFDWAEFLCLADDLLKQVDGDATLSQGRQEAAYRTIMGRSYYAAFHVCKAALSAHYSISLPNEHKQIRENLADYAGRSDISKTKAKRARKLHTYFQRVLASRVEADYGAVLKKSARQSAQQAIRTATRILAEAPKL